MKPYHVMNFWIANRSLNIFLRSALAWSMSIVVLGSSPPADDHAPAADHAPEPAATHGDEAEEREERKPRVDRVVIIEPKKVFDKEATSAEILKYKDLASSLWRGGEHELAEKYFSAALGAPVHLPEKEDVLFAMGELYQESGMHPKAAATFERLVEEFPNSRRAPTIYMELGHLYREMGGLEIAISKYYMVLNSSLNASVDQVEKFRTLSLKAKLEIAKTHMDLLDFDEAFRQYDLLSRLELEPIERRSVQYRVCHLLYNMGNYQQAASKLKQFLEDYAVSPHSPEIRYLLAKSYEKLNRKPDALREVVLILQRQSSPDTALDDDADYWKQRMGNELANEFYQQGDYRSALTIYQSLAKYNATPAWRWPAIHQIGLCFERLGLPEKAVMAYQEILDPENGDLTDEKTLDPGMLSLREMAKWRLDHLNWEDDLVARLNVLGAR